MVGIVCYGSYDDEISMVRIMRYGSYDISGCEKRLTHQNCTRYVLQLEMCKRIVFCPRTILILFRKEIGEDPPPPPGPPSGENGTQSRRAPHGVRVFPI